MCAVVIVASVVLGLATVAQAETTTAAPLSPSARAALETGEPLTIMPPLHGGPYEFPVDTDAYVPDTYGAARSDVPGGWHHGDDIFAPLGTPVVAVANGTLNRVGWEKLGGWRLWVRDRYGDEFYYAHLAGYSPAALNDKHVHRGEVIGFVGNTGDAFTTIPHLHFEIHPRSLLFLQYNGAVDPTAYLAKWPRPSDLRPPRPVTPRLPHAAEPRLEATQNFRELLHARGLKPLKPHAKPARIAAPTLPAVMPVLVLTPQHRTAVRFLWAAASAAGACSLLGLVMWRRERRSRP